MEEEVIPLSPIRKSIAEHMVRSKQIAPHVTTVHEADMGRVVAYQKAHEAEFARQGVKLTYTAFFVQAVVAALKAFPIVNATYTEQGIMMKRDLNIGVAVAIDDGLIVPVIKNADDKSLLGIARAVNDLATRARKTFTAGRGARRHVHDYELRHLRLALRHADHQSTAVGDYGRRRDPKAGDSHRRYDRDSSDDLSRAHVRSSFARRRDRRSVYAKGQAIFGRVSSRMI